MKICVYGAGAIGGFIAAHLAQLRSFEVSVVGRGAQLAAIRERGLRVISPQGEKHAKVRATDRPAELGPQDVVFIALKQHQVTPALDGICELLGPGTAVVPPTTGIPFWYFHRLKGEHEDRRIERLDPGGRQWDRLGPERVLGCVYWIASEVIEPGVIHHDGKFASFPIGEPDGSRSPRLVRLAEAMAAAGLQAPVVDDIRAWIWVKMISSLTWNPVAVLTLATLGELNARPEVVAVVRRMMTEADALARQLGVERMPMSIDERIAGARSAGAHKMSMLQDLERGRPLELDVLRDSITAMRDLAGASTPTIDEIYGLLALRVDMPGSSSSSNPSSPASAPASPSPACGRGPG